jgi:glycosyltransferase involved in cell wall biosynthesis
MSVNTLRVLALTGYPVESASTRFRLVQLLPRLSAAGIEVSVRPFVDSATWRTLYDRTAVTRTAVGLLKGGAGRVADLMGARHFDVLLVLREAMLAGPPVVEYLARALGRFPMVLDLDDPTWIGYDSPTYGRLARLLKWPGKTLTLIDKADVVTCGSNHVARFVASRGQAAAVIPAVVDTDLFRPRPPCSSDPPLVGWVGTHSSFPYLRAIVPALEAVARTRPFRLLVVGAGSSRLSVAGVEVQHRAWDLRREPYDFASLDVGLYPLPHDEWAEGKSALKSVQYLACGVSFVASPVGAAAEVGVAGTTHLLADTTGAWTAALASLLDDSAARTKMGQEGRSYALHHHSTEVGARLLGDVLRRVRRVKS